MKKFFFLFVALFVCCTLASAQSELGLPPNEEQPEPTIFHPELPYSYSSILVTPMGNAVSCYDAKSGAEYKKYEGESKYSITLKENVDGKSVATVYDIFPDSKSYQILMQLPWPSNPKPMPIKEELITYEGRWCVMSDDGKWITDVETGIQLCDECDDTYRINIKLEEQPASLFKIPAGYTKMADSEMNSFFQEKFKQWEQSQGIKVE